MLSDSKHSVGFSLLELAIVLTIFAFVVGGVVGGATLMRQGELVRTGSEVNRYISAITGFKTKYNAIPGDFARATSLWGALNADPSLCNYGVSTTTTTTTCNGNGNGIIYEYVYGEYWHFWKHLYNGGFIDNNYAVNYLGSGVANKPGVHVPSLSISGGGLSAIYGSVCDGSGGTEFTGTCGNLLVMGKEWPGGTGNPTVTGILYTAEAKDFDTKFDDGRPQYGKIRVGRQAGCTNTINDNSANEYKLSDTSVTCSLEFVGQF